MIKVSVLYPNDEGSTFDMKYYIEKHMPMVQGKLGDACKKTDVDLGLSGAETGSKPIYIAMSHQYFDSVESFRNSFGPNAAEIVADIPNYTNTQPVVQISDVIIRPKATFQTKVR